MSYLDLAKKAERELKDPQTSSGLFLPKNTGKTGKDGRLLREVEHDEARWPADNVLTRESVPGVSVGDVLRVFGGRVIEEHKPLSCRHCNGQKRVPAWRRDGKIIWRIWADGRCDWGCHFCGRASGNR